MANLKMSSGKNRGQYIHSFWVVLISLPVDRMNWATFREVGLEIPESSNIFFMQTFKTVLVMKKFCEKKGLKTSFECQRGFPERLVSRLIRLSNIGDQNETCLRRLSDAEM